MKCEKFFVIDRNLSTRAAVCHALSAIGYALPFDRVGDIGPRWPEAGWVVVSDEGDVVVETMEQLHALDLYYPLIAYSTNATTARVVHALLSGAVGYLDWPSAEEALALHLESFRASAADRIGRAAAGMHARRLLRELSPRERDVVEALSQGQTNREIAITLGISPRTVEIHRAHALDKLQASNSIDAAKLVFQAAVAPTRTSARDKPTSPAHELAFSVG